MARVSSSLMATLLGAKPVDAGAISAGWVLSAKRLSNQKHSTEHLEWDKEFVIRNVVRGCRTEHRVLVPGCVPGTPIAVGGPRLYATASSGGGVPGS